MRPLRALKALSRLYKALMKVADQGILPSVSSSARRLCGIQGSLKTWRCARQDPIVGRPSEPYKVMPLKAL